MIWGKMWYSQPVLEELGMKIPETVEAFLTYLRTVKEKKPKLIPLFFKSGPKCLSVLTIGIAYELALQIGSSKEKFMKEFTEVRRVENRK